MDKTKSFLPFDPTKDQLQERSRGSLLVEIQPFLLITSQDHLIIDTGLGFSGAGGKLQIHENLIGHQVQPEQITKVLMSHLHKDHSGGISTQNETGDRELSFPNAVYYVNKNELQEALAKPGSSYHADELALLQHNPRVILYEDQGTIDGYIRHERSGGHSPYHQVFWIREEGETYFYGGDEAPQLSQLQRRFMAKYDFDGRKSMELRQQYLQNGKKEGWTFLFYHDIKTPFIKFEE